MVWRYGDKHCIIVDQDMNVIQNRDFSNMIIKRRGGYAPYLSLQL